MAITGLTFFFVGGVGVIAHLFLYEWNREAGREAKWLIAIGCIASAVLTLTGATLCAHTMYADGVTLPEVSMSVTPYTVVLALFGLLAVWFWMQRGLFGKVAALACVYVLLVFFNIVPNPSGVDRPWPLWVMVGLIGIRGLASLGW